LIGNWVPYVEQQKTPPPAAAAADGMALQALP
jgi:hypothetical protein